VASSSHAARLPPRPDRSQLQSPGRRRQADGLSPEQVFKWAAAVKTIIIFTAKLALSPCRGRMIRTGRPATMGDRPDS
jgi:hypothetical protein